MFDARMAVSQVGLGRHISSFERKHRPFWGVPIETLPVFAEMVEHVINDLS